MSQVLVSPPLPTMAMAPVVGVMEPSSSHLHLSAANPARDSDAPTAPSIDEKIMVSELAYLASQHHTSEYNRLKFGPAGAPFPYVPLSIQSPAQVQEMRSKQAQNARKKTWWPAEPPSRACTCERNLDQIRTCAPDCRLRATLSENFNFAPYPQISNAPELAFGELPMGMNKPLPALSYPPALNLSQEISMAMSSTLSIINIPQLSSCQQPNLTIRAKTSESHPINITPIIPIELLPSMSSKLIPTPAHTPYMFELPSSFLLNNGTASTPRLPSETPSSYPMARTDSKVYSSYLNGANPPAPVPVYLNMRKERPWQGISKSPAQVDEGVLSEKHQGVPIPASITDVLLRSQNIPVALTPTPTSIASIQDPSLLLSGSNRSQSAPPSYISSLTISSEIFDEVSPRPPLPDVVDAMSSDILSNNQDNARLEKIGTSHPPADVPPSTPWTRYLSTPLVLSFPMLGNMLLSSCPGKKVRLDGPVKGRGAICRDLRHDLRRVRALGVACVICCLDDEELEFLGASWSEYSEIARQIGLDVLRIPIPEGLAPATPAEVDEHILYIIHSYTLKGLPVLAHCRGGVGRAGLVASCWILKLGLCGWLSRPPVQEKSDSPKRGHGDQTVKVRKEVVQLVERVITIVRRRRSVKAIETYEQVRFLVDYVEHLHRRGEKLLGRSVVIP